jgi:signal transduction histidine kinase
MSIRLRLTLWYTGILAVTLLIFGAGLYSVLSYYVNMSLREDLKDQAEKVSRRLQLSGAYLSPGGIGFELSLDINDIRSGNTLLQFVNLSTGTVSQSLILTQAGLKLPLSESTIQTINKKGESFDKATLSGGGQEQISLLMYSMPYPRKGQAIGILQVASVKDPLNRFFDALQYSFALAVLVTIAVAATVGWFLARKALSPIHQVIAAADQIEKGADLSRRIPYKGPRDEIGRLIETINGMLSRIQTAYSELEESYAAQRRFVSDASHELRTPLTTIRGNVDLLEKMWQQHLAQLSEGGDAETMQSSLEAMRDIAAEAQRMSRLVNDLLSLARADAGLQIQKDEVRIKPLVEEVVRRAQFLPKTAEWKTGSLEALEGVTVYGNKDYLQQMLFIFIENAFKYTPEGTVQLDALRADDQVGIRISDTGIGMDREEVPRIFDRFYRADPSRGKTSGTGLGLSIAKWIIDEHKGSVEVETMKGRGTVFTIWLPVCFPGNRE